MNKSLYINKLIFLVWFISITSVLTYILTLPLLTAQESGKLSRPPFLDKNIPTKIITRVESTPIEITVSDNTKSYSCVEIIINCPYPAISVKSQQDLFSRAKIYEVINPSPSRLFIFTGPTGKYLITVSAFDKETGKIFEETKVITIGDDKPQPPIPPKPPGPPPVIIPDPPIIVPDPPSPTPQPTPAVDKWGLTEVISAQLSVLDVAAKSKLAAYSGIYLDLSNKLATNQIKEVPAAYTELKTRSDVLLADYATRAAFNKFNLAVNDKIAQVWPLTNQEVSVWFKIIGDTMLKYKDDMVIKPTSITVLTLYETADTSKPEYRKVNDVLYSTTIRAYLNAHKVDWRSWDKDVIPTHEPTKWADAKKLVEAYTIPNMTIFDQNNKVVEVIKLIENNKAKTEVEVLDIIKKYTQSP